MIDWIVIGLAVLTVLLGFFTGGGNTLSRMSGGIIGRISTLVIFYFTFGVVLNFAFVQDLLAKFLTWIEGLDSSVLDFIVLKIRLDIIVFAVVFLVVIALVRRIIVNLIEAMLEADSAPVKVINKILGVLLSAVYFAILLLIVFQVLAWTTGENGVVYEYLSGSFLRLDELFEKNPLNAIISTFDVKSIIGG